MSLLKAMTSFPLFTFPYQPINQKYYCFSNSPTIFRALSLLGLISNDFL